MVTGTLINYYVVCQTKLWLFANRIGLEENSEDVRIGRVLHEINEDRVEEVSFDRFKLDKITKEYVIEVKKSDSDIEAAKWQLLYYLWQLEKKGIKKKGRIEVFEKKHGAKKRYEVVLDESAKKQLKSMIEKIETIIAQDRPPTPKLMQKCRKCAYYSYCFI